MNHVRYCRQGSLNLLSSTTTFLPVSISPFVSSSRCLAIVSLLLHGLEKRAYRSLVLPPPLALSLISFNAPVHTRPQLPCVLPVTTVLCRVLFSTFPPRSPPQVPPPPPLSVAFAPLVCLGTTRHRSSTRANTVSHRRHECLLVRSGSCRSMARPCKGPWGAAVLSLPSRRR